MKKKAMKKSFRQNLHVLPAGSGSFLSSSVLFFEQNMLDVEQGIQLKIINSVGPDKRRSLSPAERGRTFENIISLELHCKDKTFAEKSRYIWFILLFCTASSEYK